MWKKKLVFVVSKEGQLDFHIRSHYILYNVRGKSKEQHISIISKFCLINKSLILKVMPLVVTLSLCGVANLR